MPSGIPAPNSADLVLNAHHEAKESKEIQIWYSHIIVDEGRYITGIASGLVSLMDEISGNPVFYYLYFIFAR